MVFGYVGYFSEVALSVDAVKVGEVGPCVELNSVHDSRQFLVVVGRAVVHIVSESWTPRSLSTIIICHPIRLHNKYLFWLLLS